MKGKILAILIVCLLLQNSYAAWNLLIKSDGQGETFDGKKAYTVSADRFKDFDYDGVLGVWSSRPEDAKDDEKATVIESFKVTCGARLRLWVMGDDEFIASINGVRVLEGKNWDQIEKTTVDISDTKYNIVRCGATGVNNLKIEGKNNDDDASIAYTLEEETDCLNCKTGESFSDSLCRCALIGSAGTGSLQGPQVPSPRWNFLENPANIFSKALDFTNLTPTSLSTVQFPAGAVPQEVLLSVSAWYIVNTGSERNLVKFYQDFNNNNDASDDELEYVMMLYKRDGAVANSAFNYETQETFPLRLAEKKNLSVKPNDIVSPNSKLNVDIIGWR